MDGTGEIPKSAVSEAHLHQAEPTQSSCVTCLDHILKQITENLIEQGNNQTAISLIQINLETDEI